MMPCAESTPLTAASHPSAVAEKCCRCFERTWCCFTAEALATSATSWREACGRPSGSGLGPCVSAIAERAGVSPAHAFLGFRVVLLCYWVGIWMWTLITTLSHQPIGWCGPSWRCFGVWASALTHWSATLQLVYLSAATAATATAVCTRNGDEHEGSQAKSQHLPCIVRFVWLMQAISLPVTFVTTVSYWAFGWPSQPYFPSEIPINIFTHLSNSIVAWLDFFVGGLPMFLSHMWAPMTIALLYGLQSAFKPAQYRFEGWQDNPELAACVVLVGAVSVMPFIVLMFYGLDIARSKCVPKADKV